MKTLSILVGALVATSVLVAPAEAQQKRKTLFQIWADKAKENRAKRLAAKRKKLGLDKPVVAAVKEKKKPQRVETSKYYTYRVAKRAGIKITPKPITVASIETPIVASVKVSPMTQDLVKHNKLAMSSEHFLAKAVSDYYSENQEYRWLNEKGEWNAKARSVARVLENAEAYGLNKLDYAVEVKGLGERPEAAIRLEKEIGFSVAALRYAMDAKFGTINPNRLSGYHDFAVHYEKSLDVFEEIMGPSLPAGKLVTMHPANEKFMALRQELVDLKVAQDDIIELKTDILIKPGNSHEELPNVIAAIKKRASQVLLEEHAEFLGIYADELAYTEAAVKLVKAYQKEAGLGADGIIGRNTATKLAGLSSNNKKDRVILAMERLRWHPHQLGERHVFINQPEYRARYIEAGKEKLSMRVVVGKKSNQTNFFHDEIEHVTYNPYWGVPRSIIVNEFAPKSRANPGYLDQRGYEVAYNGKRVNSSSINWGNVGPRSNISVRQPPGNKNALGSLKIMFPNKHAIYMHDTPAKSLFKKQHRAFSHGCVRLHDPQAMAAAVLGTTKNDVFSKINQGTNQTQKLGAKVPVYISYFTAWPQEDGTVKYFGDVYGRDAHLLKAIKATRKSRAVNIAS